MPAGLDPVRAGRYGLWLLGLRSHRAASLRVAFPKMRVGTRSLTDRFRVLFLPWKVYEYPGPCRFLGELCGVHPETARRWIQGSKVLPPRHGERLAAYLEQHAAQCEALARELRSDIEKKRKPSRKPAGKRLTGP